MTVINTNTASLNAQYNLNKVNKEMEAAMEQLSSGKRINAASDDAAGLSISTRMESNARGLSMAIKNAGDAQSLIDTSEGAHQEVTNILQRMRELAVQSASDTNTSADRAALNDEVNQLVLEIDRIAAQTTWGGMQLMDGTYQSKTFQLGSYANETVGVSIDSIASADLGSHTVDSLSHLMEGAALAGATDTRTATGLVITGPTNAASIAFAAKSSAKTVAAAVNAQSATTGVSASAKTNLVLDTLSHAGTVSFNLTGTGTSAISTSVAATSDLTSIRDAVNAVAGTTGITASMYQGDKGQLMLTSATGEDIKIETFASSGNASSSIKAYVTDFDGTKAATTDTLTRGGASTDSLIVAGEVRFSSVGSFTVVDAASGATGYMAAGSTAASQAAVSAVNISTLTGANRAITTIDGALNKISDARANLGAVSNRIDHTISNLGNVLINTQASQSRIQDADFAKVTGDLTKSQIMSQAATAMLAQANASKQGVLSLLQG
ncbi:MAG: flagellin [Planktomarina sp.]|nr:flagellin [Planktomarina sp.]